MRRCLLILLALAAWHIHAQDVRPPFKADVLPSATHERITSVSSYCTQYQAVYDALTTKPSSSIANAQNTFVQTLVDSGIWAKLDVLYVFAQSTNGDSEALVNWISPGIYNATLNSAPAFTALEGFAGGAGKWINTNYNPTSHAVNFAQNASTCCVYVRTDNGAANEAEYGAITGVYIYQLSRWGADKYGFVLNSGTQAGVNGSTDATGFYSLTRQEVNYHKLRRNKVEISNTWRPSTGIPDENIYVLGAKNGASVWNPSTRQVSMFSLGGNLSATESDNYQDAFEIYMDSNSKGIIP